MIKFAKTTLSNGLRVITAPMKDTKAVTVLVLVGTGSRYETKEQNGISHFLEHMFFKGTKRRPTSLDISKELDNVGASYNAFTSSEMTGFYIKTLSSHFDLALDVLADILANSKFDPREMTKEKGVIIEEINMYQDIPQRYVWELYQKLLYGDTALGRSTLGSKKTVQSFSQKDLLGYKNSLYQPQNMIIAVAGQQNNTHWLAEIKAYFSQSQSSQKARFGKVANRQSNPQSITYYKKTDQAHFILGVRTFPRIDGRRPTLKVLNTLLGDIMSSRLFTEVREKRGLAYYIGSDFSDFSDCGNFTAYAGVDITKTEEAIKVILEELAKLKKDLVPKEELNKAKENLKGTMYLGLEGSMSIAEFLGEQELFWSKIESPEEIIEKVMKVTAEDIRKLAKEIFIQKHLNLALIGPYKETGRFDKLLKL